MVKFVTFKGSWPWRWPWIGSYCIPSCITHRPLPTYQISLKSKKLFVDGRTDGHLRPTLLGRATRRSRPKNQRTCIFCGCSMCMESATDRVETVLINCAVQAQTENVSVYFIMTDYQKTTILELDMCPRLTHNTNNHCIVLQSAVSFPGVATNLGDLWPL